MQASNDTDILQQLQQINTELAKQNTELRARVQELRQRRIRERAGFSNRVVDLVFYRALWIKERVDKRVKRG